jgi:hypothetical protein
MWSNEKKSVHIDRSAENTTAIDLAAARARELDTGSVAALDYRDEMRRIRRNLAAQMQRNEHGQSRQ